MPIRPSWLYKYISLVFLRYHNNIYCGASNASLHLAIFAKMLSTDALQIKTRGFWL
jgi:hypothetical protein